MTEPADDKGAGGGNGPPNGPGDDIPSIAPEVGGTTGGPPKPRLGEPGPDTKEPKTFGKLKAPLEVAGGIPPGALELKLSPPNCDVIFINES